MKFMLNLNLYDTICVLGVTEDEKTIYQGSGSTARSQQNGKHNGKGLEKNKKKKGERDKGMVDIE